MKKSITKLFRCRLELIPLCGIGVGMDYNQRYNQLIILLPFISIELGVKKTEKL